MRDYASIIRYMGLWDLDDIKITVINDNWVRFSCPLRVVNGPEEVLDVKYTLIDRLLKVSFEDKIKREYDKFVEELKTRNEKILKLREKERRLYNLL